MKILSMVLVIAGFVIGALISELSLRGVQNETRGALLSAFAKLRLTHLVVLVGVLAVSFVVPWAFWPAVVMYFAFATVIAVRKLRTLELPARCRRLQALSVASVFFGVAAGGVASWLA